MKDLIIYHRVDLDGVCSAAIVANHLKDKDMDYDTLGWTYGDNIPDLKEKYATIWVLDISFGDKQREMFDIWSKDNTTVIWIDHHKTAIEQYHIPLACGIRPEGVREVGKAACLLTWNFIHTENKPNKLVEYLSVYDVWNKTIYDWDNVLAVQYSVRAKVGLSVNKMMELLEDFEDDDIKNFSIEGSAIIRANSIRNVGECLNFSFEGKINNMKAVFMNTLEFNSTTFKSVYNKEFYDVMIPFAVQPNGLVRFSIYTEKEDIDCGVIAKMFGGGGHRGAAGFLIDVASERFAKFLKTKTIESNE